MSLPKRNLFLSAVLLALLCVAIPRCQTTGPPPPCGAPAVPVTISLAGGNLAVDKPDVHVSVRCNQYVEWTVSDPTIVDYVVIFKPFEDSDPHKPAKHLDRPSCASKKCKTNVPTAANYGKNPYAIVGWTGQLLVLDPQVTVDP